MLRQSLVQKQQQKLSPQQIKLMKLIQLPAAVLEQRVKEELQENPALEEGEEDLEEPVADEQETDEREEDSEEEKEEDTAGDDEIDIGEYLQDDDIPEYKTSVNNTSPDEEHKTSPVVFAASFSDMLLDQVGISDLGERQRKIATQIIGSIDDDGYLRRPLAQVVDDLAFSQNLSASEQEIGEVLKVIQTFDPPGIGARDLRECLMLQLGRNGLDEPEEILAMRILDEHFSEFSNKQYQKIQADLEISDQELKDAMTVILRLNPKPGSTFGDTQKSIQHVIPDFIITNNDGKLELSLNSRNAPELRVSRAYKEMLEHYAKSKKPNRSEKDAVMFVKQKLDAAQWFIDALNERQRTLMTTMQAILDYQYEYFLTGDETKLKPMVLKHIAEKTGYDISTISRVSNSKYVQTPHGTILLKFFFSEGVKTESGEEASSREVKRILQDWISTEDKKRPLTDEKLMMMLNEKGYKLARRTVAKYREMLNIPMARMRKEI